MSEVKLKGDWGVAAGDIVKTKKSHPCGGDSWFVIRQGADVKMRCETCGRVVSLARREFLARVKTVLSHGKEQEGTDSE
ncbi:MAG: DUF951 domain-containing protein [Clostridia bacterium]|nr:DUF951 domain-containing protein [Clostridia bacterium]